MKRARVMVGGVVYGAPERDGQVVLDDGRRLWPDQVTWLPPLAPTDRPRTILALGLNYANHAKELAFKAETVTVRGKTFEVYPDRPKTLKPAP